MNAFTLLAKEVEPSLREFSLAAASLADSVGIALADICGILVQVWLQLPVIIDCMRSRPRLCSWACHVSKAACILFAEDALTIKPPQHGIER